MSFIGATGLNSFQEEIQDISNYIESRVLEVQSIENVNMTDTSNYTKRLHTELKNEIGYEGSTLTNPPLFGTGLYFRIETQEYLVGNPKVETALGNVPASGLFEKIEHTSNYISRIDNDSSNYVDRVEGELSTRIGYAATITPPSVATGVYVPIEELQGEITTIQEEITTIQGEITTIQEEISGIEGQITALETEVGASTLLDTFTNFWTGTPSIYAGIAAAATLAGTAQTTASSANTKADTALTLWNKGTGNYTNNIYHLKSGNVGIGTNTDTILNNKLEVNGSINIATGNKYKINNVDFSYSDLAGTMPIATTINLGGVKPDGTTITITADGTISSQGGGGGVVGNVNITDLEPPDTYDVITTEIVDTRLTDSTEPTTTPSVPKQIPTDKYQYITLTYESAHPNYSSSVVNNQRTFTLPFSENVVADILIVAGGGGGGGSIGGGGGGGSVIYSTGIQIPANTYTIKVGKGGSGGINATDGTNGYNSEAFGAVAVGGGRGGDYNISGSRASGGSGGGTGGGANYGQGVGIALAGNKTISSSSLLYSNYSYYANDGGNALWQDGSVNETTGGGGGGAGTKGSSFNGVSYGGSGVNNDYIGKGGDGIPISITGVSVYYGAGGGGGSHKGSLTEWLGKSGGLGGGGNGGSEFSNGTKTSGTNGTGYGAGGGGGAYTYNGGNGGSGIVIIRYYVVSSITHKYLAFTTPTTYSVNFPVNTTCDILAINNSQYFKTSEVILNGSYDVIVGSTSKIQQNSTDLYVPNTNLSLTDSITGASITYTTNTPIVIIRYSMGSSTTTTITTPVQPYGYLKYDAIENDWIITEIPTIPTNLSQLTGTLPYTSITGTPTIPSNLSQLSGSIPYSSITGTPTIPTIPANYDSLYYRKSDLVKIVERTGYLISGFNGVYSYEATFKIMTNLILNEYGRPQLQYRYWLSMSIADSSLSSHYWAGFVFYDQQSATFTTRSAVSNTSGWTLSWEWGAVGDHYLKVVFTHNSSLAQYLNVTFC